MDPMDFWHGLEVSLKAHHGERGLRLSARASLNIAYALIVLPYVMVATALAVFGGVLYAIAGRLDASSALKLSMVALAILVGLPVSMLITYVTTRGLKGKMVKKVAEERRWLREHLREHNETPAWHIVIRTPEEAVEKREQIKSIIRRYADEVLEQEYGEATQ